MNSAQIRHRVRFFCIKNTTTNLKINPRQGGWGGGGVLKCYISRHKCFPSYVIGIKKVVANFGANNFCLIESTSYLPTLKY